jgi:hypothetical protein
VPYLSQNCSFAVKQATNTTKVAYKPRLYKNPLMVALLYTLAEVKKRSIEKIGKGSLSSDNLPNQEPYFQTVMKMSFFLILEMGLY